MRRQSSLHGIILIADFVVISYSVESADKVHAIEARLYSARERIATGVL